MYSFNTSFVEFTMFWDKGTLAVSTKGSGGRGTDLKCETLL